MRIGSFMRSFSCVSVHGISLLSQHSVDFLQLLLQQLGLIADDGQQVEADLALGVGGNALAYARAHQGRPVLLQGQI